MKKHQLFLIAGALWSIAGVMVTFHGVKAWMSVHPWWVDVLAVLIYLIFYRFIFSKLVVKHEHRIMDDPAERLPWWKFFDRNSYIIMFIMMAGGIALRKSGLLPLAFFSFFYTGLGLALFTCGLRFLSLFIKHRNKLERQNA